MLFVFTDIMVLDADQFVTHIAAFPMCMPVTVAPGCAFGFWHMWGVLQARRPTGDVWCISGSSLAMAIHLCDLEFETQLLYCSQLRSVMNVFNVFRVVRFWLENQLPDDCHTRCNGRMTVLLRRVKRAFSIEYVSHWYSKTDLIDCLMAACNPMFPSSFRGSWYVDCLRYRPSPGCSTLPYRIVVHPPTEEGARDLYAAGLRDGR